MEVGKLRHRVTIQKPTIFSGEGGGWSEGWEDWVKGWASIEPLSGKELLEAQQVASTVTHRIRMRYRAGVQPTMRVLFGDRIFEVTRVIDPMERGRELELMAEEKVGDLDGTGDESGD
ncbi:phage head-tail adaptor, putative, SPP1 family [Marininema mesophilum]|uniref:Phage head-tail adaptor, putative, SPP1 family n=1 Tax=Marininema mesophilum TaxID=1048340 RepID=A0A1H3BTK5_9BACL|nr:phage head closure protein [Marininema mesophilum]SDX45136.1 phage head-tail adaptor, putative, SPP1 family [Marininema mesophilum]